MLDQFCHVANAVGILNGGVGTPQDRLVDGGSEFWRAMAYLGKWPPDLLKKAKRIGTALLWDGFPVEGAGATAAFMKRRYTIGEWATEIANDMANLAADIEQARTEGRLPSTEAAIVPLANVLCIESMSEVR